MKRVGSYEAKTHLPRLLAEVEAGETVVITRHGVDIAKIVPVKQQRSDEVADAMARIRARRKLMPRVTVEEIIEMRNEGRKPLE